MIHQTKTDLDLLKHQRQKDRKIFKAHIQDAAENVREKCQEVFSRQSADFDAERNEHRQKVKQLEAELEKSLNENGLL